MKRNFDPPEPELTSLATGGPSCTSTLNIPDSSEKQHLSIFGTLLWGAAI